MLPNGLKKKVEAELIESMKKEVKDHHQAIHTDFTSRNYMIGCFDYSDFFRIDRDAAGQILCRDEIVSLEEIRTLASKYYLFNEGLSLKETASSIQYPTSSYYDFPFYSRITKAGILSEISKNKLELERAKEEEEEDFIQFYQELLSNWELKLEAIEVLDVKELVEIHPQAQIRIDDDLNTIGLSPLTLEAIKGLIQVRDYASHKYFDRSYLDLYFEATRYTDSRAEEKLTAIDFLYPIKITDYSYAELNGLNLGWVSIENVIPPIEE
ncbi:hypothetical protein N9L43_00325 [bacterium]|nr:hypothetical protein [bacterium]